jgi:hypothetical protein
MVVVVVVVVVVAAIVLVVVVVLIVMVFMASGVATNNAHVPDGRSPTRSHSSDGRLSDQEALVAIMRVTDGHSSTTKGDNSYRIILPLPARRRLTQTDEG